MSAAKRAQVATIACIVGVAVLLPLLDWAITTVPVCDPPAVIAKVLMLGRAAGDRWP